MTSKQQVYEVKNERGEVRASFVTRWQAEKFAEQHKGFKVVAREALVFLKDKED